MISTPLNLFGGDEKWRSAEWTSSDDRVRGGKSQSYLDLSTSNHVAKFHGDLDIQTLGGAGFASQRTVDEDRVWDLSSYDGVQIIVKKSDSKRYTFNLKDELLPQNPDNGREQSTISYEYDFQIPENATLANSSTLFIPWDAMKATYRGKEKCDAPRLNAAHIKRFGIMMRSFFGEQEGAFSLQLESISAVKATPDTLLPKVSVATGLLTHTKEDGCDISITHPPSQQKSRNQAQLNPVNSERSTLKTVLLALLGFTALLVLFFRQPGIPAMGWTIPSCVRRHPQEEYNQISDT